MRKFQNILDLEPLPNEVENELAYKDRLDYELAILALHETQGNKKTRKQTLKELASIAGVNSGRRMAKERIKHAADNPENFVILVNRDRTGITGAAIVARNVSIFCMNASIGGVEKEPLLTGTFIEAWGENLPDLYAAASEHALMLDENSTLLTLESTRDPSIPLKSGLRGLTQKKYNQDVLHAIGQTMPFIQQVGYMQRSDMPNPLVPVHSQLYVG